MPTDNHSLTGQDGPWFSIRATNIATSIVIVLFWQLVLTIQLSWQKRPPEPFASAWGRDIVVQHMMDMEYGESLSCWWPHFIPSHYCLAEFFVVGANSTSSYPDLQGRGILLSLMIFACHLLMMAQKMSLEEFARMCFANRDCSHCSRLGGDEIGNNPGGIKCDGRDANARPCR